MPLGKGKTFLGVLGMCLLASTAEAQTAPQSLVNDILALSREEDFPRLTGPWTLALPGDHGAHPEARGETWSLAAHLKDEQGAPITIHFALARLGLSAVAPETPFAPDNLWRGHVIVAPVGKTAPAIAVERVSRGLGAAGADAEFGEVWLDTWTLRNNSTEMLTFDLDTDATRIRLRLEPAKLPLALSPDGEAPFRGYTQPRLKVAGTIGDTEVTGTGWLDHHWGDVPLPGGPLAYDRLVLHLDDGTDLGLIRTRRRDGTGIATLDGTLIDASGEITFVTDETLALTATDEWRSDSGVSYPVAWRFAGAGLDLAVTPLEADQHHAFGFPLWSGGVLVDGTKAGQTVTGQGTLQLTGYEE